MFVEVIRPNEIIEGTFGKGLTSSSYDILDIIFSKIKNDNNTCIEININDYINKINLIYTGIWRRLLKPLLLKMIRNNNE